MNQRSRAPQKKEQPTPKVAPRPYGVEFNELLKFAANLNSGGVQKPYPRAAIELLRSVVYRNNGDGRRSLTDEEITELIARGYKLTV